MNRKNRMKLCSNCDGMIDLDVILCPYCGEDVSKEKKDNISIDNLYPPPYNPNYQKNIEEDFQEKSFQEKIFQEKDSEKTLEKTLEKEDILENKKEEKSSFLFPFLLFSLGINLFLFGIFLLLFSANGEIFLKWNAKLWFIYILLGLPLILIGNKLFSKLKL